jgi:eukaryotic-like serine/threonine-protein kinase
MVMAERAKEIFADALEAPVAERDALVQRACGGDAALLAEVTRLLGSHGEAGEFMAGPTVAGSGGPPTPPNGVAGGLAEGPGGRIGPYKLLQQIGEGAFGVVFMAEQERPVVRRVALKVVKLGMDTRAVIARFEAERQALAMMDHPNIATVLDGGSTETGRPYFVMDLVKGQPITAYCDRNHLAIPERLALFGQVCRAVQHAHQKGIIHRDLKPSNILVSEQDGRAHARVIDFGIAKATAARLTDRTLFTEFHQLIGTPAYMSPEQAAGSLDVDTRSDVYSLGVLLYELLTGMTPFDAHQLGSAAPAEIQRIIQEVEPEKPSTRLSHANGTLLDLAASRHTDPRALARGLRGDLDWIVMKAMEKDRRRRYETADAIIADVDRHLRDDPVEASPPGKVYRIGKLVRRHRRMVIAGATVAVALVGGLGAATWGLVEARRQGQAADLAAQQYRMIFNFVRKSMIGDEEYADSGNEDRKVRDLADRISMDAGDNASPVVQAGVRQLLGEMYLSVSRLDQARPHLEYALGVWRANRDPQAADVGLTLANVLWMQGTSGAHEAEKLAREARGLLAARFGETSAEVVKADLHIAEAMRWQGRINDAVQMLFRTKVAANNLGPTPGSALLRAHVLTAYGSALKEQGPPSFGQADLSLREAEEIYREVGGKDSLWLANALTLHADLLGQVEDQQAAAEGAVMEGLQIRQQKLSPTSTQLAQSFATLGALRLRQGRYKEAINLLTDARRLYLGRYRPDHTNVAVVTIALGDALWNEGTVESRAQAEKELAEVVRVLEAQNPPNPPMLANAYDSLGRFLIDTGRGPEGLVQLLRAEQVLAESGERQVLLERIRVDVRNLYEHMGEAEKAAEWNRKLPRG